jgi:hypothetical protein
MKYEKLMPIRVNSLHADKNRKAHKFGKLPIVYRPSVILLLSVTYAKACGGQRLPCL